MCYAIVTTVVCVVFAILIHLLILQLLWKYGQPRITTGTGIGIAAMVLGCTIGHLLEIGVFALGLFITASLDGDTRLALTAYQREDLDLWFYSASFYTSLGTDRPPSAALRLFAACEALTGLILITWTASFLFLLMQKSWPAVTAKRD